MDIIIKIKQINIETIKKYNNVDFVVYDKSNEQLKISFANHYNTETYNGTLDYEIIKLNIAEE